MQIFVNWLTSDGELEAELAAAFGLDEALVLQASPNAHISSLEMLARSDGRALSGGTPHRGRHAGHLPGASTYEVIRPFVPTSASCERGPSAGQHAVHTGRVGPAPPLARQLAQKLGGDVHYLSAPFMAEDAADAAVLRRQRTVAATLDKARAADIALLGIGTATPAAPALCAGYVTAAALGRMRRAVWWATWPGVSTTAPATSGPRKSTCVVGLTLEDLRAIPLAMAVAMGEEKGRRRSGGTAHGRARRPW
ncbi:MAG: sugar-binding domain-containing protein [Caldilineaceae bacterium]